MTYSPPYLPPARRLVKTWDIVLTVVLLMLLAVLAVLISFVGLFLSMASDPCGTSVVCNFTLIEVGFSLATIGPWVVFVLTVFAAILLMVARRVAFWVPLAGAPLIIGCWFVGAAIASAGVPT